MPKTDVELAIELFQSLNLKGWKESQHRLTRPNHFQNQEIDIAGGGQAYILAVDHESGRKGVWRRLKNEGTIPLQRFFREIQVLSDPKFQHQNIVKILDRSDNESIPWYISELGGNFEDYWKRQRKLYRDDPESLLKKALDIVLQLLDGLGPLHQEGVVHRDIKPDNIIVSKSNIPILIDFGLVYVDDEAGRLTSEASAVGNYRFSPDVMMNRMNEIVPWLDVFQISQVLIWMVSVKPTKDWQRPLDWRWVNYDERLSDASVISLRALTALCSEESISPKDATELFALIHKLFVPARKSRDEKINFAKIDDGIRKGKALQAIKLAEDTRAINASYLLVKQMYETLRAEIENIYSELVSEGYPVKKVIDRFKSFYEAVTGPSRVHSDVIYGLTFGEQGAQEFYFQISCSVFIPSLRHNFSYPLPETSNIFAFLLQFDGYSDNGINFPRKTMWITHERTGELTLRDVQMAGGEETNINLLAHMIREWISDPDAWEAISRDR